MATTDYNLGEAGTLGFPVTDPVTGGPWDATGLGARLVIYRPGDDLILSGYWLTGQHTLINGATDTNATIMAFDIGPETISLPPTPYRAALQVEFQSGWKVLPGGEFILNVRRP